MALSRKTKHFIYRTVCIVTNRYYIGMHSTANLKDGYLGSGKRLKYSVKKYGKDNHTFEILEFLPDRKTLAKRESEIVNETLLTDPLCMNLVRGGNGWYGFTNADHQLKCASAGGRTTNPEKSRKASEKMKETNAKLFAQGILHAPDWTGRTHSDETKLKIGAINAVKQCGSRNSQFGTIWITNGTVNKKVNRESEIPINWVRGRVLNK